jgi:cupin fold WbuC family metalloprotein
VRPHKHLGKPESFHVIEGIVDVIIFDECGDIREVIQMGNYGSDRVFYYRISTPIYHTLLIRSDILVFHETTTGPFNRVDTVFAPWSPEEIDSSGCALFTEKLLLLAENFFK